MSKVILVTVPMIAIADGYYQNRIIKAGEEFIYHGGLNRKNGLPLWAEPKDPEAAEKAVQAALSGAKKSPALPENLSAPVAPAAPVAPVKALTKQELVAKLVFEGKGSASELNKLKVADLQALDVPSLDSVM